MLYRYTIENYRSFKERTELSLIPLKKEDRHIIQDEIPVLKTAVIYGANASGKSNLIKSIGFARDIILNNKQIEQSGNPCYRLDSESVHKPTIFSFEINIDTKLYQYGFAISFYQSTIVEEWLYELKTDKEILLFNRRFNFETNAYETSFNNETILNEKDKNRLYVYVDDLEKANSKLLLTEIAQKKISDSELISEINNVYSWFDKLTILFPNSVFNLLIAVDANELKVNEIYKDYFKTFDIGIENIHLEEVSIDLLRLDKELLMKIKSNLITKKEERNRKVMLNIRGQEYLIEQNELGDLNAKEVKFRHQNDTIKDVDFRKDEESDGTQRLFDLIPVLSRLVKHENVIIIDELDRSLHSLLTKRFIELFLLHSQNVKSQLICTTHEVLLLDLDLLRKDEIWFVKKNMQGESQLYPLAQFKLKHEAEIERNYLLGRYGAIPIL